MPHTGTAQLKLHHSRPGGITTLGVLDALHCGQELSQQLCMKLGITPWAWQIFQVYFRDESEQANSIETPKLMVCVHHHQKALLNPGALSYQHCHR